MPTKWTPKLIAEKVDGELAGGIAENAKITTFEIRPNTVRRNSFYTPIDWPPLLENMERMSWRIKAKNAVGCFYSKDRARMNDLKCILVDDPAEALKKLARTSRSEFDGKIVGITGTAGKTTTKTLLGHVLREIGPTWVTRINQNLAPHILANLCEIDSQYDNAVIEIGLDSIEMVEAASSFVLPNISIITSIGIQHAEGLENPLEKIINAKTEIIRYTQDDGFAILPSYSEHFPALLKRAKEIGGQTRVLTCGFNEDDHTRIISMQNDVDKTVVTVRIGSEEVEFETPYPGEHIGLNSALVATAVHALGYPLSAVKAIETAGNPHSVTKRYSVAKSPDVKYQVVNNSFNTSALSIRALLKYSELFDAPKKCLIISDIGALGDSSTEVHASVVEYIDAANFDHVFLVGPHMSGTAAPLLKTPATTYETAESAYQDCESQLGDGDVVFVKGNAWLKFADIFKRLQSEGRLSEIS